MIPNFLSLSTLRETPHTLFYYLNSHIIKLTIRQDKTNVAKNQTLFLVPNTYPILNCHLLIHCVRIQLCCGVRIQLLIFLSFRRVVAKEDADGVDVKLNALQESLEEKENLIRDLKDQIKLHSMDTFYRADLVCSVVQVKLI